MGSKSDWDVMEPCLKTLSEFGVEYRVDVISAHRTPKKMFAYAEGARESGLKVIIAGAGGAAHVAGVVAGLTTIPVIGVPIRTQMMGGLDSLLSIVQMPSGVPVLTVAVNASKNAALAAVSILALSDETLSEKLQKFRENQTQAVLDISLEKDSI